MEAIFIEYAIMEDRAEAILRYEGNEIKPKNEQEFITITRKLNKITNLAQKKKSLPQRYFSDGIIEDLQSWIKRRNALIHALLKKELTTDEVEAFALEGKVLTRTICNKANNYKKQKRTFGGLAFLMQIGYDRIRNDKNRQTVFCGLDMSF